jgi:hypothetical protein
MKAGSAVRTPGHGYGGVVGLHLSQIAEADELLTNDPLALLIWDGARPASIGTIEWDRRSRNPL